MKFVFVFVFAVTFSTFSLVSSSVNILREVVAVNKDILNDVMISEFVLELRYGVITPMRCQAHCLQNSSCKSYFYNQETGLCQTNSVIFTSSGKAQANNGVKYYTLHVDGIKPFHPDTLWVHFVHIMKTWDDAEQYCANNSEELISIETLPKFQYIADHIRNNQRLNIPNVMYHVGASDREKEGSWLWETRVVVESDMWCSGQPDDGGVSDTQDTAAMVNTPTCDFTLDDVSASQMAYFICEKKH